MSTNPLPKSLPIEGKKLFIVDDQKAIEFEFKRVCRSSEYDDIVIQFYNPPFTGEQHNPLFIRNNTLFTYYKTTDQEYIKMVDAIGMFVAGAYNLKVAGKI